VRYATRPGEREVLVGASREWLDFRGRRIAMWRWGAGPLVLLAHGWSGRGAQLAAFVEPLVEAGFSVLAWDAPGHGRSEGLRTDLPEFAALVEAVARRERDVHAIIGHSLGALAAALACARGARVRRVVFVSGPAEPASFFRMCLQAAGLSAPSQAAAMSEMERVHAFRWDDTNLVRRSAALAGVPSLVIHDLADLDVPYREGARVAAAWPGSRLLATRGLGHRRILRDAVVVDAAVRFVSEGAGVAYRTEAERLESDLFDRRGRWAALGESTAAVA
jgi:pimeloyl-ACP methyl ester carboxylesterase